MKATRTLLLLFIGAVIGVAATIGVQQFRRARFIRLLPSPAERTHPPLIDEISSVTLSHRDGRLNYDVRDGMGGPRKDFLTLLELERHFSEGEPIWAIRFESGVTSDDLEATVETLSKLGVKRYFIGYSIYGKSVLQ